MAKIKHREEIRKEEVIRAGTLFTYRGEELDLRKLMFALDCKRNGLSPWPDTPSNKAGAS